MSSDISDDPKNTNQKIDDSPSVSNSKHGDDGTIRILELERANLLCDAKKSADKGESFINDEIFFQIILLSLKIEMVNVSPVVEDETTLLRQLKVGTVWKTIENLYKSINIVFTQEETKMRWLKIASASRNKFKLLHENYKCPDYKISNIDLEIIYNFPTILDFNVEMDPIQSLTESIKTCDINDKQIIDLTETNTNESNENITELPNKENVENDNSNPVIAATNEVQPCSSNNNNPKNTSHVQINENLEESDINIIISSEDEDRPLATMIKNKITDNVIDSPDQQTNNIKKSKINDNKRKIVLFPDKRNKKKPTYKPINNSSNEKQPEIHWTNWWKNYCKNDPTIKTIPKKHKKIVKKHRKKKNTITQTSDDSKCSNDSSHDDSQPLKKRKDVTKNNENTEENEEEVAVCFLQKEMI